ncbi:Trehalose operon transcriptional repressor [Streptococcus sp. DD10]|uniref:trehalose operon repressor n=1 Tax=Streptococcus sp. DD10 TaxID=1777878 RepID=UPI00079C95B6|nr:trehalose operon repressor [Streptococcus sp. DD10]KXT73533.1 Trehalose operon transcriptional repressor [Streptococcus sp. DD10]
MKKYQELAKKIEKDLQNEIYIVGEFLPSEHQLMEQYQLSRDTVRKALAQLEKDGLIKKFRGQGSKVIREEKINFPVSELTSYQELVHRLGIHSKTNVVSLETIRVDSKLSQLTGFPEHCLVWRVTRQRIVEDITSVLDIDYLNKSMIPKLTREIAEQSIYHYLEDELGFDIAYAQKEITISQATDRDHILMDIGNNQHVVSVKSKVYLQDGRQFQFTESRHKLEKFRFIDYARRKK